MTNPSDLKERLRYWESDGHPHGLLHREAAERISQLEQALERAEGRIRILVWNSEKAKGNRDEDAIKTVEQELAALGGGE